MLSLMVVICGFHVKSFRTRLIYIPTIPLPPPSPQFSGVRYFVSHYSGSNYQNQIKFKAIQLVPLI